METMPWSDDTRCLYCDGKLPLFRRLSQGQFCSRAHQDAYWKDQEQLAVQRLHETHDSLREYRPPEDVESILGPLPPASGEPSLTPEDLLGPAGAGEQELGYWQPSYAQHAAEPPAEAGNPPPAAPEPVSALDSAEDLPLHPEFAQESIQDADPELTQEFSNPALAARLMEQSPSYLPEPAGTPSGVEAAPALPSGGDPEPAPEPEVPAAEIVTESLADGGMQVTDPAEAGAVAQFDFDTPRWMPIALVAADPVEFEMTPATAWPKWSAALAAGQRLSDAIPLADGLLHAAGGAVPALGTLEPVSRFIDGRTPALPEHVYLDLAPPVSGAVSFDPLAARNRSSAPRGEVDAAEFATGMALPLSSNARPIDADYEQLRFDSLPVLDRMLALPAPAGTAGLAIQSAEAQPLPFEGQTLLAWDAPATDSSLSEDLPMAGLRRLAETGAAAANLSRQPSSGMDAGVEPLRFAAQPARPESRMPVAGLEPDAAALLPGSVELRPVAWMGAPRNASAPEPVDRSAAIEPVSTLSTDAVPATGPRMSGLLELAPRMQPGAAGAHSEILPLTYAQRPALGARNLTAADLARPEYPMATEMKPIRYLLERCSAAAGRTGPSLATVVAEPVQRPPLLPQCRLEPVGVKRPRINPLRGVTEFWGKAPRDLKMLVFAIPVLIGLAFAPSLPKVSIEAPETTGGFTDGFKQAISAKVASAQQAIMSRAAIVLDEDFRSGLDDWVSRGGAVTRWSFDQTGFVKPGPLALYEPSMGLTDYDMQFLGMIEEGALSWVVRASDFENYYVVKLAMWQGGPLPKIVLTRYAVIDGVAQDRVDTAVPLDVREDTLYRVRLAVRGDDITIMVQDRVIDTWSEPRLPRGGIGFFTSRGEESRVRWVQLTHQYDTLGRLCAYLAPYNFSVPSEGW